MSKSRNALSHLPRHSLNMILRVKLDVSETPEVRPTHLRPNRRVGSFGEGELDGEDTGKKFRGKAHLLLKPF